MCKNDVKLKFQDPYIKSYWDTATPTVYFTYDCFHTAMTESSTCNRNRMT